MSELIQQIRAAYERDQQYLERKVLDGRDIPLRFEAITADWLTQVLCKPVSADAKVLSHRLGPPDDGSSNRRQISVEYNATGIAAGLPASLFCKASHGLANRILLGVSGGAAAETAYYTRIRPTLAIESPRGFHAAFDPESFNSIVLLEDLSRSVKEFCSQRTHMTLERAQSELRALATLHARYFGKAEQAEGALTHFKSWPQYFGDTLAFGLQQGSEQGFLDGEAVIPSRLFQRHREIWHYTLASVALHDRYPKTLAHGDVHLKNWYVAGNGEMGLADWQCAHRGHWARDFAYAMSTALTVEDRRAWERDLLAYYIDRLHAAGGPLLAFDEAWTQYRQQLMTALTWWTVTLHPAPGMPDMQPRDLALEFVRRIATAIDDVESLCAFDD
jgi:hypothetical protein